MGWKKFKKKVSKTVGKVKKEVKRSSQKVKEEVKRTSGRVKKEVKRSSEKTKKEFKRIPTNISELPKKTEKEIKRIPTNIKNLPKKTENELKRLAEKILAEASRVVERIAHNGAKRFSLSKESNCLINTFIKSIAFPYKSGYPSLVFYHKAKNLATFGVDGITFKNKIYIRRKINQKNNEDLALIFHEMVHTYQYFKYGRGVFIRKYLGEIITKATLKNSFEKEAYNLENQFYSWLRKNRGKICVI